jgi:hypothetical protein
MATAYIAGPSLAEAIAQRGPLNETAACELGRRWPKAWIVGTGVIGDPHAVWGYGAGEQIAAVGEGLCPR